MTYRRSPGDWNYATIRRLLIFVLEWLCAGTQWAVFELKDPAL